MANNILITRNKGIQKQEILLLEFCKNTRKQKRGQREQTMSTMSTQQSTCFCCWDDLSYGLNTLGPLCLWQCLQNSRSGISYFRIPVFLVIRIVFHFTPRIPTIFFDHQLVRLAYMTLITNCNCDRFKLASSIVLSWYHHQPESHQQSFTKFLDGGTPGPIDRTPETLGSGKKWNSKKNIYKS